MLILKRNFILHVLKWSSVLRRVELELKVTKVVESKKATFCDVLCLDVIFDVDSDIRCVTICL